MEDTRRRSSSVPCNRRSIYDISPLRESLPQYHSVGSLYDEGGYGNDDFIDDHISELIAPHPLARLVNPPPAVSADCCMTCRTYDDNKSLHQHNLAMPFSVPLLSVNAQMIRIYHLSLDSTCLDSKKRKRLEMAVVDFLCPLEVPEEVMPYIAFLGFNCEVRMGDPKNGEEDEVWYARGLIGSCPQPKHRVNYAELVKDMQMYSGPLFKELKLVKCPNTVTQFLHLMNLDSKGYRLIRIVKPYEDSTDDLTTDLLGLHFN